MCLQVRLDHSHRPAQFLSVLSIAWIAETAEPLMGMRLQDGGTGTDNFPPLASGVARSTDIMQTALRGRPIGGHWQSTLTGGLACAIDIENQKVGCSPGPRDRLTAPRSLADAPTGLRETARARLRLAQARAPPKSVRASNEQEDGP